jgi:hypothetical protein
LYQNWLIRMYKFARNPPSQARVKLVLGVIVACFALGGIEWLGLWPEFLQVNPRIKP